ncbi:DUF4190 domain-containing protein [Nocardioides caricicola]|uniref:DUF4190 domain-containing protein n=1 Tax=Nocardioides caricicola TaxID=634770 RepID=A0ABW0MTR2_9ACTN
MSDNAPPPYGEQPPNPYGQQPPGQPPYQPYGQQPQYYGPRDHPQATVILVLGIIGLVACQVLSVFAWVMGNRVVKEIDASGGQLGGRSTANAGRICGIVGTVLLAISLAFVLLFVVIGIASMGTA